MFFGVVVFNFVVDKGLIIVVIIMSFEGIFFRIFVII